MIDLRSDTVTHPTPAMREAARDAEVGDDVYGEDPTVNELQATAADVLGKEAALYLPSGTMANQTAALTHTSPGEEVILERESHIYGWESGSLAVHAGLQSRPLDGGDRGLFRPQAVRSAIVPPSMHSPATGLVCVENTHNHAGGTAHHPDEVDALAGVAAEHGIPLHLDGARLFNAAVALDLAPETLAAPADSVMVSLSKGLGAPVGSVLAGDEGFIAAARNHRKRLGGGMRQAGIIAAPALVGLASWERLSEDHVRAERLAAGLEEHDGLAVKAPETNILLVDVADTGMDPGEFLAACEREGVLGVQFGETVVRFCTHRDVDDDDVEAAIAGVGRAIDV